MGPDQEGDQHNFGNATPSSYFYDKPLSAAKSINNKRCQGIDSVESFNMAQALNSFSRDMWPLMMMR